MPVVAWASAALSHGQAVAVLVVDPASTGDVGTDDVRVTVCVTGTVSGADECSAGDDVQAETTARPSAIVARARIRITPR